MTEKITVTIKGLLEDLDEGLTRPEIAKKYGLTLTDVREIFKHDKLKDKKARTAPRFILIDDTDDAPNQPELPLEEVDDKPKEDPNPMKVEVAEAEAPIPQPVSTPTPADTVEPPSTNALI